MGVKAKAAVAIVVLLLFLGSMWLQGSLDYHWDSCLKNYNQLNPLPHRPPNGTNVFDGEDELEECPGQTFQVSMLLSHLLAAPVPSSDVLLVPYLSSWDELIKFMEALGPMVGLISQEIETKTSIIRQLALEEEERSAGGGGGGGGGAAGSAANLLPGDTAEGGRKGTKASRGGAYTSVRSMIWTELKRHLVDFEHQTDSGCRTLLRLHRALQWLQLFLEKLSVSQPGVRLRSPSDLCREAYQNTLAHHHPWYVRNAAVMAFIAMPERAFFYRLVCVQNQDEAEVVLHRVVRAIGVVYNRTQAALEEHGMLDLP